MDDNIERMNAPQRMDGILDDSASWFGEQYDAASGWLSDQWNAVGDYLTDGIDYAAAEWNAAVQRWHAAVAELDQNLQRHESMRNIAAQLGPDELAEWEAQSAKAEAIRAAIVSLRDKLSSVGKWAGGVFGSQTLNGMGFLPVIPIAIITGSIAAVGAVSYAIYSYDNQLAAKWEYINAHPELTPDQVNEVLDNSGGSILPSITGNVNSLAMWIAIGGAVFVLGPHIVKMLNKKES